jgi:hypothetical protein
LSYTRVSELETRIYSRQLLKYSNLGLDGESDADVISVVTGALVLGGAASGALISQDLPAPDIVRWTLSLLCIFSPFGFLALGLATPAVVQRGVAAVRYVVSPAYRARMLRHEAGHFLLGHLVGLPVVAYSTNAGSSAVECADPEPSAELEDDEILNRLAVVSLAGIVAECLCFGKATGGLADLSQLQLAQYRARTGDRPRDERDEDEKNRVRWAALQAYTLLHGNGAAFERLAVAMAAGLSVSECEAALEGLQPVRARPGAAELAYSYADGEWPVERQAKAATREAKAARKAAEGSVVVDDDASAGVRARALLERARAIVTRDPSLSAAVVAALGAVGVCLEAVVKGTPMH